MQASGWCCMRTIFLQILLIFSSPEGYQLQFSIPRAYFVYTVWHCTGQHCSSIYACMYHLFAGMWCPLVTVITTRYYVAIIFTVRLHVMQRMILLSKFCPSVRRVYCDRIKQCTPDILTSHEMAITLVL